MHVGLANVGIGLDEAHVRGNVIHRVDPLRELRERAFGQTETLLADVAGHRTYSRREFLFPDFGELQGIAYPFQPMLGAAGTHQAMHEQAVVPAEELAQEETPHEAGRPGQKNLAKAVRRYRLGRRRARQRRMNDAAQLIHVPAALRRQLAHERRHHPAGDTWFCHDALSFLAAGPR